MNRRQFLKITRDVFLTACWSGTISSLSCSHSYNPLQANRVQRQIAKLPDYKIQSPIHYGSPGCMVGIYYNYNYKWRHEEHIKNFGISPTFAYAPFRMTSVLDPIDEFIVQKEIASIAELGVIPFVSYHAAVPLNPDNRPKDPREKNVLEDIVSGRYDKNITQFAQNLKKIVGEQYGGFFIRTLREMNMSSDYWPWCGQPEKARKAWVHIWEIFELEGTNKYATWVLNMYVHHWGPGESYFPGDKYFDWIGMNAYALENEDPNELFGYGIWSYTRGYPNKPVMIAETGIESERLKPKWIKNAFAYAKDQSLDAIAFWSENWKIYGVGINSMINSSHEAITAFRECVSDPYFSVSAFNKKIS